ncbi:MAG: 4-hydroxy-tetrahydrodipicolinate reductase [Bacteroidales bacterium]|jgi:4-hydroxy-tetrahydrodipicolinate reductase|nr:4-hydroxy-tetrahydrodipicolinate reductase [Bacteroidales bacterium]
MRIALIGYGKIGVEIEKIALSRGHSINLIIDKNNESDLNSVEKNTIDVAIEFTSPESAVKNIQKCFGLNIPVVCGTTGWTNDLDSIVNYCKSNNKTFFYASNYSLGVNIFFKINRFLAKIMNDYQAYEPHIEETHHTQKLDAPSGTAITLADGLIQSVERKTKWVKENASSNDELVIKSFREGQVPGNHKVIYESTFDTIQIEHDAKSRQGFALGAVLAAEFIAGKTGYFTMNDLLTI